VEVEMGVPMLESSEMVEEERLVVQAFPEASMASW
jgi:hypothetical protein